MNKGIIEIELNEVWELLNKPHRFYRHLYEQVRKHPTGEVNLLDFDEETKKEILERISIIGNLEN